MTYIDVRGLRTGLNDMSLGNWTFVPNALGEVVSQKDAIGQTTGQQTTFEYDLLGRMKKRIEPDGTSEWTWGTSASLDEIGRLKQSPGPVTPRSREYDTVGRLKKRSVTVEGTTHHSTSPITASVSSTPSRTQPALRARASSSSTSTPTAI